MTSLLQDARAISITSPLGENVLALRCMHATEELGRPFRYELDLESDDPGIEHEDLLGECVTVELELPNGETRFFNGLVSRFSNTGVRGRRASYHATLRPWIWFLTRTSGCRIFQNLTVPEIVNEVCRDHGFSDLEERLSGSYRTWEYCVQYRETDFAFVSRLLEQEGIYYFFEHDDGRHTLVLTDDPSSHEAAPGFERIAYRPPGSDLRPGEAETVTEWVVSKEVQPGGYTLRDFDFERPRADLEVRLNDPQPHGHAEFTLYDYPGEYLQSSEGDDVVRVRMQELAAQHERTHGRSTCRGLEVGRRFELHEHPSESQNREYLVVSASCCVTEQAFESGGEGGGEGPTYTCSFAATDARTVFRPARATPKPSIQGPQTAIVVGPQGEEIWTDEFGRVKVRFHWDRESAGDEESSCWIRVSQPWAGKSWGAMFVPRIGQEVIVEFLEGDPDRPLITGRVYNGTHRPPFPLPDQAAVSGVRTSSTPGDDGYNEMSFDDTAGEERVTIHAQLDMNTAVERNESATIGNNRSVSVGGDHTESVTGEQKVEVTEDRRVEVGGAQHVTVDGEVHETFRQSQTVGVTGERSVEVGEADTLTVGGLRRETLEDGHTTTVTGTEFTMVDGDRTVTVSGPSTHSAGELLALQGSDVVVEATSGTIRLVAGGSSIEISPSGITIQSSGPVAVNGSTIDLNC